MSFLQTKDLHASIEGKEILTGLNLAIDKDEVHALMGPNGSGKEYFCKRIAWAPKI